MSDTERMDLFGSVEHTDDNDDKWIDLPTNPTNQDMMDYMVVTLTRELATEKAFKGGYVLNQLLGNQSRLTHDVDFSVAKEEDYEEIQQILLRISEVFYEKGLIESYRLKPEIKKGMSGGIDFYDKQGTKCLGVDVGLHDISWGVQFYDFKVVTTKAFEIERMLSDKITAITTRKRFRRTKDLFDVFVLTSNFDFDYGKLQEYVALHDSLQWENLPFTEEVLIQYRHAWDKLVLTNVDGLSLGKPLFRDALNRYYYLALALKNGEVHSSWDHRVLAWRA